METRQEKTEWLQRSALQIRRNILTLAHLGGKNGAHVGGALSSADILATLYGSILRVSPEKWNDPERDRFILSKGHSAIGLYATLYEFGFLTQEEFESFEQNDGILPAHCVACPERGIEISSGSLGMGLAFGIGSALAGKRKGQQYRVFVLMGDGECDEGSVWEAALLGASLKLDNLIAIVDENRLQLDGETKHTPLAPILSAMGWNTVSVDGHSIKALLNVFEGLTNNGKPTAVIASTVKGKGCSFMEGQVTFHHALLTEQQFHAAMEELNNA